MWGVHIDALFLKISITKIFANKCILPLCPCYIKTISTNQMSRMYSTMKFEFVKDKYCHVLKEKIKIKFPPILVLFNV